MRPASSIESTDSMTVEGLERPPDLVGLEWPDEVPRRPGNGGDLRLALLDTVLAERRQPRGDRGNEPLGRHGLGHGDEGDGTRIPSDPSRRVRDLFEHTLTSLDEASDSDSLTGCQSTAGRRSGGRGEGGGEHRSERAQTPVSEERSGRRTHRPPGGDLLPAEEAWDLQVIRVVCGGALDRHGLADRALDAGRRGGRCGTVVLGRNDVEATVARLDALALELLEEVPLAWRSNRRRGIARLGRCRAARVPLSHAVEAGRDDSDHHLVAEPLVEARPEDDVRLWIGCGANLLGGLCHLEQAEGRGAGDVEENSLRALDVDLQERARDRLSSCLDGAVLADARPIPMSADPASFMIARTSAKSRLISPGIVMMSLIPWTPWRSTSSTTRNASMIEVFFWTTSLSRSFGIVISVSTWALSSSAAFSAIELALGAFEAERLRHDADRQRACFLGHLGDDRSGPGAGPAAEPGGDEDHVRVGERLGDLL